MLIAEYSYETDIKVQRREAYREGLAEGIEQGIEQGAEQKAIETAKNMLCDKLSVESVSKYTGLSLETIDKLATELTKVSTL